LYVFGGLYERYGRPQGPGDLRQFGVANDLWRFNPESSAWQLLEANDGHTEFGAGPRRPGARFLASTAVVGDDVYLFGGETILRQGWMGRGVNDLWRRRLPDGDWEMIHPDNGWCQFTSGNSPVPQIRGGQGTAVVDEVIYVFAGWAGTVPLIYANDLWAYDTRSNRWERRSPWEPPERSGYGAGSRHPGRRFCPCMFAVDGFLYVFGGRDDDIHGSGARYFNDLWRYDPHEDRWELLQPNRGPTEGAGETVPEGRYAIDHALLDGCFYVFGGQGGGTCERNDFWRLHIAEGRWERLMPLRLQKGFKDDLSHPRQRRGCGLAEIAGRLYLFGGCDFFHGSPENECPQMLNDLWVWTPR